MQGYGSLYHAQVRAAMPAVCAQFGYQVRPHLGSQRFQFVARQTFHIVGRLYFL